MKNKTGLLKFIKRAIECEPKDADREWVKAELAAWLKNEQAVSGKSNGMVIHYFDDDLTVRQLKNEVNKWSDTDKNGKELPAWVSMRNANGTEPQVLYKVDPVLFGSMFGDTIKFRRYAPFEQQVDKDGVAKKEPEQPGSIVYP